MRPISISPISTTAPEWTPQNSAGVPAGQPRASRPAIGPLNRAPEVFDQLLAVSHLAFLEDIVHVHLHRGGR